MKQFLCKGLRGAPYSWTEVEDRFPQSAEVLNDLPVGASTYDVDGDVWMRLPDLMLQDDAPSAQLRVEHLPGETIFYVPADRLERIATAVTEGMVSTIRTEDDYQRIRSLAAGRGMSVSQWIACDAVKQAHALIAELAKQA